MTFLKAPKPMFCTPMNCFTSFNLIRKIIMTSNSFLSNNPV